MEVTNKILVDRDIEVKKSKLHGKGLFAKRDIAKGCVLGYCETVEAKRKTMYTLHVDDRPYNVKCHLKYINHNSKPNVVYYDDFSVVALRNIKAGEELTHHYGEDWL